MSRRTRQRPTRTPATPWLALLALGLAAPGAAQDANILLPIDTLEQRLTSGQFQIIDARASRGLPDERTSRAALSFHDGTMLVVKWAPAPSGGEEFNNNPRYEVGAYELQKLFLEPHELVVPPTVMRAFPLAWYRTTMNEDANATFWNTRAVVVALQYWLFNVTPDDFWDEDRFATDTAYARNFANFNIVTFLVRHRDQNEGNFLISAAPENPRVFSVDNGLAFDSEPSDQGDRWRRMVVDRIPASTVERLRALTEDDLIAQLGTLAQFRIQADGTLTPEPPGPALNENQGVRRNDEIIQFGLTRREIRGVWNRIRNLLDDVDDGDIQLF